MDAHYPQHQHKQQYVVPPAVGGLFRDREYKKLPKGRMLPLAVKHRIVLERDGAPVVARQLLEVPHIGQPIRTVGRARLAHHARQQLLQGEAHQRRFAQHTVHVRAVSDPAEQCHLVDVYLADSSPVPSPGAELGLVRFVGGAAGAFEVLGRSGCAKSGRYLRYSCSTVNVVSLIGSSSAEAQPQPDSLFQRFLHLFYHFLFLFHDFGLLFIFPTGHDSKNGFVTGFIHEKF
uniref:Uncharacterized protein n=1 Tax=Anopheles coluzzii TaxID=1518534 RepID=A0A8W7Q270_ANOCL